MLSALSGRLRDPFTACWDISARGVLKAIIVLVYVSLWLIKFSGHMSVYCPPLSAWAELIFGARPWPTHLV